MVQNPKNDNSQTALTHDVILVGAGPVGLVASLLLSKYQVPHLLVEHLKKPDNHPQAHFINSRTLEILRELDGLDQAVLAQSAPLEQWRRFVYCTRLLDLPALGQIEPDSPGSLLGVVDHFADIPVNTHSPVRVTHFPQHDFVRLLRAHVVKSRFCRLLEGYKAAVREFSDHVTVTLNNCHSSGGRQVRTRFLVAADGAHSTIRNQLGIQLTSNTGTLQHLMNVHFFSSQLSDLIRSRIPAMLYFVYARHGVAVFVAHALDRGEFVAQIPYFVPHQSSADFDEDRCVEMLQQFVGMPFRFDVRSIRSWRMGIWQATRFQSRGERCFLIGDAAHQFTPAGGFGMNTGIQDAHNLIWKIVTALRGSSKPESGRIELLLSSYAAERQPIARQNAEISVQNFKATLRIPRAMGLDLRIANRVSRLTARIPGPRILKRFIFQSAMRLGLKQVDWMKSNHVIARRRRRAICKIFTNARQQTLQLLFPGQDLGFIYQKGWLDVRDKTTENRFDPFVYTPELRLGGRMPHFWLNASNGQRISVLDLPSLMTGSGGWPCHVLLVDAEAEMAQKVFDRTHREKFKPSKIVTVRLQSESQEGAYFSFHPGRPAFLPRSFVALMRPDGHIAWLQTL